MEDKRGFELVMNTAVVMILAIVVLLVLIGFFMIGSGDFMDKIRGYFSYSNVDSVVSGCNLLVDSGSVNAFCCEKKKVKYNEGGKKEGEFSCSELIDKGFVSGLKKVSCSGSCGGLNEESCVSGGGRWNNCGNKCEIMNKGDVFCIQVCEEICECGTISGLGCPSGYECKMPEGIADALGYCEVIDES